MTGLRWRPAAVSDAASMVSLFRVIEQVAPIGLETGLAEVQGRVSRPQLNLDRDTLAGFDADGRLVAYAEAADMGVGHGQVRIRLTSALHPDLGDDILPAALNWLLARARGLVRERGADLPGLGARCAATGHAWLAALTWAGFEIARWHHDL